MCARVNCLTQHKFRGAEIKSISVIGMRSNCNGRQWYKQSFRLCGAQTTKQIRRKFKWCRREKSNKQKKISVKMWMSYFSLLFAPVIYPFATIFSTESNWMQFFRAIIDGMSAQNSTFCTHFQPICVCFRFLQRQFNCCWSIRAATTFTPFSFSLVILSFHSKRQFWFSAQTDNNTHWIACTR